MTAATSRDARHVRESFGDAMAAAFELVMTPAIFALFGWLIDGQIGTWPVFTLVLGGIVLTYEVWKLVHWYNTELDLQLAERRAANAAENAASADPPAARS